jgi:hypothetical protein
MDFLKSQFVGSSSDVENAEASFAAVAEVFPKGSRTHLSLPWNLAVQSTELTLKMMRIQAGEKMADDFVNDYLFKIVNLLLMQQ